MRKYIVCGIAAVGGVFLALGIAGATTTVTPPSLDFGEQAVGTTTPEAMPVFVTTSCDPGTPTVINTVTTTPCFTDSFNPEISITGPFTQTNDCPQTLTGTDTGPESCTILVKFAPTAVGPATGELTVTDGTIVSEAGTRAVGPGVHTVALSGTGTGGGNPSPGGGNANVAAACPTINATASGFKPRTPTQPTVLGVRSRLAVGQPSAMEIDATLGYNENGQSKTANLGHRSLTNLGSRKLRLALPDSLRSVLPRHTKVNLELDVAVTPLSKCSGEVKGHLSLKTKVVNVSTKLLTP
jgi:hypothetical protein